MRGAAASIAAPLNSASALDLAAAGDARLVPPPEAGGECDMVRQANEMAARMKARGLLVNGGGEIEEFDPDC